MPYQLNYELNNGMKFESPVIVPDNSQHDLDHPEILKSCERLKTKLLKQQKDIKTIEVIKL